MKKTIFNLSTLVLLALAYILDTGGVFVYFLAAAVAHELGHIVAVYVIGGTVRGFEPAPFGFCLRFDGLMGYGCDAAIAAGGGAMNLLLAFILAVAAKCVPAAEVCNRAAGAMLVVGIYSLLPAQPLDGGRVLYALTAWFSDDRLAYLVTRAASIIVGAGLTALGLYILFKTRYNMSILAVGGLILASNIQKGYRKNTAARA
jgi:Zn-dependent protease